MIMLPLTDTNRKQAFTTFRHLNTIRNRTLQKNRWLLINCYPYPSQFQMMKADLKNLLQASPKSFTYKSKKTTLCIRGDRFRLSPSNVVVWRNDVWQIVFCHTRLFTPCHFIANSIEASRNQFAQTKPIAFLYRYKHTIAEIFARRDLFPFYSPFFC